ncbi:MAG: hypothetical protein ACE5FF_15250 [Saprospiraceae bacterium]
MKKTLFIIVVVAMAGAGIGYLMYNKPHENMTRAKVDFKMTAAELFTTFEEDEAAANEKYLDKTIEVNGKVLDVKTDDEGKTGVMLDAGGMFGVNCKLDDFTPPKRTGFQPGEEVTFKCKCTGVLMDVVMVRCVEL